LSKKKDAFLFPIHCLNKRIHGGEAIKMKK